VPLSVPTNITVDHSVKDSVLEATISWAHGVPTAPFEGLETIVTLYTDELLGSPHVIPHNVIQYKVSHEDPVNWGTLYSLRTCVGSDHCGEETERARVFPNSILSPPKNIEVSHGLDATQGAYAHIVWENSIEEEFGGLFTVLNTWVPSATGARRKRNTEGHKETHLSFSETSQRILLVDVDEGSMFSLQAAIGNSSDMIKGEESEPMELFDESLVSLKPPAGVVIHDSEVIDDTLTTEIEWETPELTPPLRLNIYGSEGDLVKSIPMEKGQENIKVGLEGEIPWDATFTLSAS